MLLANVRFFSSRFSFAAPRPWWQRSLSLHVSVAGVGSLRCRPFLPSLLPFLRPPPLLRNPLDTQPPFLCTPSTASPPPPPSNTNPNQSLAAANRASARMSTYSAAPTLAPSIAPSHVSRASSTAEDPKAHDIKSWNAGFERLEDQRLVQQRYKLTHEKTENMGKLALGAKLDRALSRRMSGQDAVFRSKGLSEKAMEAQA